MDAANGMLPAIADGTIINDRSQIKRCTARTILGLDGEYALVKLGGTWGMGMMAELLKV